jgi:hypothetical protein
MTTGGNQGANQRQAKEILYFHSYLSTLKTLKQKVSFIKNNTTHMLSFEPKIGAKLIFFYEMGKFLRVYTHDI